MAAFWIHPEVLEVPKTYQCPPSIPTAPNILTAPDIPAVPKMYLGPTPGQSKQPLPESYT